MDLKKLKQMVTKACGSTLQVKRMMLALKPEDEKTLLRLCTIPAYKHFIPELFKELFGEQTEQTEQPNISLPYDNSTIPDDIKVEELPEDEEPMEENNGVPDEKVEETNETVAEPVAEENEVVEEPVAEEQSADEVIDNEEVAEPVAGENEVIEEPVADTVAEPVAEENTKTEEKTKKKGRGKKK